jgi:transcriptional regulator with XRE-family HTH domain
MDKTLGQVIRSRRKELDLTQEALAERVADGVSQADISRLENDRVDLPRRSRLEQLARALDMPLASLLIHSAWNDAPDEIAELGPANTGQPARPDIPELAETVSQMHELIHHAESIIADADAALEDAGPSPSSNGQRPVRAGSPNS